MMASVLWMNSFLHFILCFLIWTAKKRIVTGSEDVFQNEICGTRPMFNQPRPETRVFNGQDATTGAWPWVGLYKSRYMCSAVLIDDQWALTLTSCTSGDENASLVFGDRLREVQNSSRHRDRQEIKVLRAYRHPEFIYLVQNDIALLQLETPVNITDYVRPICINQLSNEWDVYRNCWIAGWGIVNAHDGYPGALQEAPSRVITPEKCQEQHTPFRMTIHGSQMCGLTGGNGEPRFCSGDFGTSMMCSDNADRWYVVGLAAIVVYPCGNNTSIYSRISNLTSFIDATARRVAECMEPDYLCNDGVVCVFDGEMCDGVEQCPNGEDEMDCPVTMCTDTPCRNGGTCTDNDEGYTCECTEGLTGTNCETVNCGEANIAIAVGSSVNLSSPFYPGYYTSSLSCEWTVTVMEGYKVLVEFPDFNVEEGFDFLRLDDTKFSGFYPPANFTSVNEFLEIQFTTDYRSTLTGFLLKLSAIDVSGINECEWNPCENNGVCIDEYDGYSCECEGIWSGRICHAPSEDAYCGEQEIILSSDSYRNLTSFNYPGLNVYQSEYSCKWIVTAPPGRHVRVDFKDLQLYQSWDIISLNAQIFTGFVTPQEDYVSDGDRLEIVFTTNGIPPSMGFHLVLSDYLPPDGDECQSQPCQNGGICYDNENGFTCKCRRGLSGKTCQTGVSRCGRNRFQCNKGRCIKASTVCDGRNNCGDGSDELNCDCEFNCHNGRCIPERYVCDKNNNCGDRSDELRPNC